MTFGTTPDSLEQCIEEWLEAYARGEVADILQFYHAPLLVIAPDEWHWLTAADEVEQFMRAFLDDGQTGDHSESETEELHVHQLTGSDALVSLSMSRYDAHGDLVDQVGYTDLFHHTDDGWKAAVAIVHGADAVLS